MKCLECGRRGFALLGNHVRKKHQMLPDDYRRKYNIPLTEALADGDLREHLSRKAKIRLLTDEGVEHMRRMTACNSYDGGPGSRDLPEISTRHCIETNARKARACLEGKLPAVLPDWIAGISSRDIALRHAVAMPTLRKWVRDGHLPKRKRLVVVA